MEAIIGVIGTVIGTILGWLLNSISQRGKISAYVSQWDNNFKHNKLLGKEPTVLTEKIVSYNYSIAIDFYNSSGETKIMRDIKIVFRNNKKSLVESMPDDRSVSKTVGKFTFYEKLSAVNIPPKSVLTLKLRGDILSDAQKTMPFWKTNKVVLQYKDESNKEKSILLIKESFEKYRESDTTEVTEHG